MLHPQLHAGSSTVKLLLEKRQPDCATLHAAPQAAIRLLAAGHSVRLVHQDHRRQARGAQFHKQPLGAAELGFPQQQAASHWCWHDGSIDAAHSSEARRVQLELLCANKALVAELLARCNEAGDIYKANYSGYYCVDCEEYKVQGLALANVRA